MSRDRDTFDLFHRNEDRGRFGDNEIAGPRNGGITGSSPLHDFDLAIHAETHPGNSEKGAILVSETGNETKAVWIPKSLCQFERREMMVTGTKKDGQKIQLNLAKVTIEQWVARDKGLL